MYVHEMDDAGQIEMLEIIRKSNAKIIVSGYDSELYNHFLNGWNTDTTITTTTAATKAKEKIWFNYEPPTIQICIEGCEK